MNEENSSLELQVSEDLAKYNRIIYREVKPFKKNKNLSHIVHALLHISQFITVLAIEAFHHIDHYVNRKIREKNPNVPELPEERHIIFIVIPFCMLISLFLGTLWIISKRVNKKTELGLLGCSFGAILMLLNAIFSMRHAHLYINLEEISNEDLLEHPVFIHSFTICILAIFALALYLLHFWLLYECWRWRRKQQTENTASRLSRDANNQVSSKSTESSDSSNLFDQISQRRSISDEFSTSETFDEDDPQLTPTLDRIIIKNVEDEPVILYCFCIDCWNYSKYYYNKRNHGNHEYNNHETV